MKNQRLNVGTTIALLFAVSFSSWAAEAGRSKEIKKAKVQADLTYSRPISTTSLATQETAYYVQRRTKELLPGPWRPRAAKISVAFMENAARYEMDPLFLMAVVKGESRFNPGARGRHGEIGLMQIKPSTAQWLLERGEVIGLPADLKLNSYDQITKALHDPAINLTFGTAYLSHLRNKYAGRGPLFLAAYNMGTGMLKNQLKNGRMPHRYADRVAATYVQLAREMNASRDRRVRQIARISPTYGLFL